MTPEEQLAVAFPQLVLGEFEITSDCDGRYNCIAWALGDTRGWWWPSRVPIRGQRWPTDAPPDCTLESFRVAFQSLGYHETADQTYEPGKEKVAVFVDANDTPTHAAYLAADGRWTSKLGRSWDIHHDRVDGVGGPKPGYGEPRLIMVREDVAEMAATPFSATGVH